MSRCLHQTDRIPTRWWPTRRWGAMRRCNVFRCQLSAILHMAIAAGPRSWAPGGCKVASAWLHWRTDVAVQMAGAFKLQC